MQLGSACSNINADDYSPSQRNRIYIYKSIINYKATNIPPPAQHSTQLLPKSRVAESFCHQSVTKVSPATFQGAILIGQKLQVKVPESWSCRTYDLELLGVFVWQNCIAMSCPILANSFIIPINLSIAAYADG